MKRAVVLLSGGLDSAVTAYCARKDVGKTGELHAISFDYGQKHYRELDCAAIIGEGLGVVTHPIIRIIGLESLDTALLSGSVTEVPTAGVKEGIPSTWVPQRNSIFLALAFAYAETVDADMVYAGFNCIDYSGYPDCRPEFVDSINKALNLASKRFVETGRGIGIVTPLIRLSKSEIILLGDKMGVPFEDTWSCYLGGEKACGVCDSCRIRLKGFKEAGIEDPIEYEEE